MAVFISYSSRERELLERLTKALRQAHEQVWLDEELGGGEAWWGEILEQIRACDVFIVALSKNSLESKPCQAELQYADALGKPIVPVQVGPLDSMRVNPLAALQTIDYRDPTIQTSIELISTMHARRAKLRPLPDPLPDEPPMPFAYLMRLASTIGGPQLSAQQQSSLVSELKAGLEEDGNDATARRDITQLLCMLRDRSDVTWRTRTEVENVLASLDAPAVAAEPAPAAGPPAGQGGPPPQPAAGPPAGQGGPPPHNGPPPYGGPPPHGGPPPYGGPPPQFVPPGGWWDPGGGSSNSTAGKPRPSRTKWIIAGGGVVAAIVAVVVVVVVVAGGNGSGPGSGQTSTPPPTPMVTSARLVSILLTADEVDSIMGTSKIVAGDVKSQMDEKPQPMSNANCAGAYSNALKAVYEGSGYTGVSDQILTIKQPNQVFVEQTAVAFPSVDQAHAFLTTSTNKWKGCAGQTVTITFSDGDSRWTFGDVTAGNSQIAQLVTQEAGSGWACQHVLRVVSNAVIEANTCHDHITDEASRMADQMAAKATG
jgi:serine/threonine kinase PknH